MSVYQKDISKLLKVLLFKYETQIVRNNNLVKKLEHFGSVEVAILEIINTEECITINTILEMIPLKRSKLVGIIKKLTEASLLKKIINDSDKRSNYMKLDKKGVELLATFHNEEEDFLDFILDDMTVNEEKTIVKFLSKINQTKHVK